MPETKGEGILLLKVKPGTAVKAQKELQGKAEVHEAQTVLGPYDLVVTGAFGRIEDLRRFSEAIAKTHFCEDCVENVSLEQWRREKPALGAAAAWTLIKAENPNRNAEELRKVPEVNAVYSTVGAYNVIAKLTAKSPRELQDSILKDVQSLHGIRRTESLAMSRGTVSPFQLGEPLEMSPDARRKVFAHSVAPLRAHPSAGPTSSRPRPRVLRDGTCPDFWRSSFLGKDQPVDHQTASLAEHLASSVVEDESVGEARPRFDDTPGRSLGSFIGRPRTDLGAPSCGW